MITKINIYDNKVISTELMLSDFFDVKTEISLNVV